jgi:hypothetical protein
MEAQDQPEPMGTRCDRAKAVAVAAGKIVELEA